MKGNNKITFYYDQITVVSFTIYLANETGIRGNILNKE